MMTTARTRCSLAGATHVACTGRRGRRIAVASALMLAALVLQGCVGRLLESDAPPVVTYRLGVVGGPGAAGPRDGADIVASPSEGAAGAGAAAPGLALVVSRPRAATSLDTNRIAIAPGGHRFDHYAGIAWAEPAPLMLQQNLVAAFESSGRFAGVLAAPARSPAELLLDVELRHFEATTTANQSAPMVHVQVQASLVDVRRGLRVTSFVSEARVRAADDARAAVIEAFERANAQVVADVASRVGEAAASLPAGPDQASSAATR